MYLFNGKQVANFSFKTIAIEAICWFNISKDGFLRLQHTFLSVVCTVATQSLTHTKGSLIQSVERLLWFVQITFYRSWGNQHVVISGKLLWATGNLIYTWMVFAVTLVLLMMLLLKAQLWIHLASCFLAVFIQFPQAAIYAWFIQKISHWNINAKHI